MHSFLTFSLRIRDVWRSSFFSTLVWIYSLCLTCMIMICVIKWQRSITWSIKMWTYRHITRIIFHIQVKKIKHPILLLLGQWNSYFACVVKYKQLQIYCDEFVCSSSSFPYLERIEWSYYLYAPSFYSIYSMPLLWIIYEQ